MESVRFGENRGEWKQRAEYQRESCPGRGEEGERGAEGRGEAEWSYRGEKIVVGCIFWEERREGER